VAFILKDNALRSRLLRIAREADPDPAWRDDFPRPGGVAGTPDAGRSSEGGAVADLSPPLLVVLASLLELEGADGEPVLRAAQQLRPGHFWINWELATSDGQEEVRGGRGLLQAALTMRPRAGGLQPARPCPRGERARDWPGRRAAGRSNSDPRTPHPSSRRRCLPEGKGHALAVLISRIEILTISG